MVQEEAIVFGLLHPEDGGTTFLSKRRVTLAQDHGFTLQRF